MTTTRQLPAYTSEAWYSDPSDHRCPHDAWLEAIEISEPAQGQRNEQRQTTITMRLFGAYHDGHIVLRYLGVQAFSLVNKSSVRGLGDWLKDEFSICNDLIAHQITWSGFGPKGESQWIIKAEEISYEWIPQSP